MQLTTLNHLLSSIFSPKYHRRHAPLTQEHDFFFISSQKTLLSYVQAWSA
ncbi:uncharacterized protein PHALS_11448 [Plasmopara halstedii]|uniref:Uncharacterized protein n=1 Tax=Plasmopara halstedii TaxID=4781 RepID=A0A0P1A5Z7_PLAHL|nr:uncharacterized protein PHALS_11448 [Plasmopara halstedii]CEG35574.1 hypothetical protein PHALS_11448 [Plasmopara halstedii]|eukprot:XP_024571943.1 hypothetical protein PHALS_11448 [Plasmopara halstedii]